MPLFQVPKTAGLAPVREAQLEQLHRRILSCRRCQDCGLIPTVRPVISDPVLSEVMLIGQAPGRLEQHSGLPFSGRAGRQLFRWLAEAGLGDETTARRTVYITSMTKCFPGAAGAGSGDRRPSATEVELCRPHLDDQLRLLSPRLLIAVGQLAIGRFIGARPMEQLIGRVFWEGGEEASEELAGWRCPPGRLLVLPLPHPSGASHWLNQMSHRAQLEQALGWLSRLVELLAGSRIAPLDCV